MNENLLRELLDQYLTEGISDSDKVRLKEIIDQPENREELEAIMQQSFLNDEFELPADVAVRSAIQEYLSVKINEGRPQRSKMIRISRYAVAASVIFIIGTAVLLLFLNRERPADKEVITQQAVTDIQPGHEGAVLTLGNGDQIILDSSANGALAQEGQTRIVKDGARISYTASGTTNVAYNTMTTPKGRTYSLVLADGSRIWLNAASSITFPTAFPGNERVVTITGEAYFEVAKDATKPFHVRTGEMDVQVLGTHFNINSYGDEGITKTTLLEGLVRIQSTNNKNHAAVIRPGEQAQLKRDELEVIKDVDTGEVMAWKNGFFQFNGASVQAVMKQIERWYDVTVSYEGVIAKRQFAGGIPRDVNLSEVLKILQESNVHFKIEKNKKLIVTP